MTYTAPRNATAATSLRAVGMSVMRRHVAVPGDVVAPEVVPPAVAAGVALMVEPALGDDDGALATQAIATSATTARPRRRTTSLLYKGAPMRRLIRAG